VSRLASARAELLRKHGLDVDQLIGFACGARCVFADKVLKP
jgi:hypothetical protein